MVLSEQHILSSFWASTHLSLLSLLCLHQSFSGNGFQLWIFPILCTPKLSTTSATRFWQQQLTTTEPQRLSDSLTHQPTPLNYLPDWLTDWLFIDGHAYTISTRTAPKHRSCAAVRLLLAGIMIYSIVACVTTGTDRTDNTIPLLLFTGSCLETTSCHSTIFALSKYATL
jgi:hypothetical protein